MDEYSGYKGRSLQFLKENKAKIGDHVEIQADEIYSGSLMPRYEQGDDQHIVLKLKSGYNIGIDLNTIDKIKIKTPSQRKEEDIKEIKENPELPKILLLTTGGTIASKIDYRTGAVTPTLTAAELYESIPELSEIANIDTEILFSEYSENITPDHWLKIANRLNQLADSDYKGILVAHGTDTMQYTSSFLSFALAGFPIPIALVGSQRSSDRPSSDATMNLLSAAKFLTSNDLKGIFVVMHYGKSDNVIASHIGTRVRKNHTSKRGAFETIGDKPAFLLYEDKTERNFKREYFENSEYTPRINLNTKSALIKYYPGFDPKIIEYLIKDGFKAIIFEGTGLGHVGKKMYDVVKKANDAGIFLGMTSQCIDGRVNMNVYESGRDLVNLGITPLKDMIPETALVKSMWAIGNYEGKEAIKKIMLQRIASEISD
ncbi:MAG: Glu-tRNA(Gln) amidotransferase subunit GatD [Nitrosopumilaceae archaeon]|nr:Glu-tRNA(Gln) amidotransferase subunit GatD [Nitrosopumilaceae archaeon]NIU00246.1 Glu-tRNA(Gln) amidotransferase subunit GatD [Nitrosopumilaceae archaeon]NIU86658.1 Glu-tRNA(Gln) amidotransferase subunit GatD [Nitrosopumilaceae archaeon]NIV65353.1 Glu-tRNA(Gln) amidotransferase subunit GatD [Nitrosopumilaceae archaeon]NIX60848.1 Glu-tRNA(Gln) amidotransferase subunit GatD [Nitrosopumilaceae archaeon]